MHFKIPIILLADNDRGFLDTRAEYLRMAGYSVITATSPEEASNVLQNTWVHLAILDIRLRDDSDEHDFSGISVARDFAPAVPKMIVTSYPSWPTVRAALTPMESKAPISDYVSKAEGVEVFLERVKQAVEKSFFNWKLSIEWMDGDPLSLALQLEPSREGAEVLNRAQELTDLFRKVFVDTDTIKLVQVVWRNSARIAIRVLAYKVTTSIDMYILVCGRLDCIRDDVSRYREYAPKGTISNVLEFLNTCETTHFGALQYSLKTEQSEDTKTFENMYRTSSPKQCATAVIQLFHLLSGWEQGKRFVDEKRSLAAIYRDLLSQGGEPLDAPRCRRAYTHCHDDYQRSGWM